MEDETGIANVIITPDLYERERLVVTRSKFVLVEGGLQNQDGVIHIKARRIQPWPSATWKYSHMTSIENISTSGPLNCRSYAPNDTERRIGSATTPLKPKEGLNGPPKLCLVDVSMESGR